MAKLFETLGKGLALAGFLFTVLTYAYNQYVDRQQERYKQAMALIGQYNEGIRKLENELVQRLLYYNAGGMNVNNENHYSDSDFDLIAKETLFGYDGQAAGSSSNIKPFLLEFMTIMDFYSRVGFCVTSNICDGRVLKEYFCPRMTTFAERNRRLFAYYEAYENSRVWSNGPDRFNRECAAG